MLTFQSVGWRFTRCETGHVRPRSRARVVLGTDTKMVRRILLQFVDLVRIRIARVDSVKTRQMSRAYRFV
jgi:hypothetical protein